MHPVIVLAREERHFLASPDGDLAWPCPNCWGECGHWYMGLVVQGSGTQQVLPWTPAVPEAAAGGALPVETGALEEEGEELPLAQVELGPSALWVPEVQVP